MSMKKWLIAAGVVLVAGLFAGGYYVYAPRRTPGGQPPLAYLTRENLEELCLQFNASPDMPRVLAMLSPT